jgi:hypothetical protein
VGPADARPAAPATAAQHIPVDLPTARADKPTCFDQITGQTASGIAISSQVMYDIELVSDGADDFACHGPKGQRTRLSKIDFIALYYGTHDGPADSFNVTVWRDDRDDTPPRSEPNDEAKPVCSYQEHDYSGLRKGSVDPTHGRIKLTADDPPCRLKNRTTYWLEIQAVMAISEGGQFGWELGAAPDRAAPPDWRNPDNTYGTGCVTFDNDRDMQSCIGFDGNLLFSIN